MGKLNIPLLNKYKQEIKKLMEAPSSRKMQKQCKTCGKK